MSTVGLEPTSQKRLHFKYSASTIPPSKKLPSIGLEPILMI